MKVKELNQDQINELKSTYLYEVENNYTYAGEIPNEVIFKHFSGINFVNDDFACSVSELKALAYKYYQLPIEHTRKFRSIDGSFFGEKEAGEKEYSVNLSDYTLVYEGQVEAESPIEALNTLFRIFNIEHPKDYKSHSMSVSDLVLVDGVGYSCEPLGWKQVEVCD